MPSIIGREWGYVNSKLMHMRDSSLVRLKIRIESNLLTQGSLEKGLQLMDDLTQDMLTVHNKLLQIDANYNGSEACHLYTTKWLPDVQALCAKLKAFNDSAGAPAVASKLSI